MKPTPQSRNEGCAGLILFVLMFLGVFGRLPWFVGAGFILVLICIFICVMAGIIWYDTNEGRKQANEERKRVDKKLRAMKMCDVIFIESRKLYAIPLHISMYEVIALHTTFSTRHKPTINFEEIRVSLTDVTLVDKTSKDLAFSTINQIASVAKDLYLNVEPQRKDLESKLSELKRLERLAMFSELYNQQADLYSRASNQVIELLEISKKLSQECHSFIIDILIGQELAKYNIDDFPDVLMVRMRLDSRCKQVSEQYKLLKSEMDEYLKLKNEL